MTLKAALPTTRTKLRYKLIRSGHRRVADVLFERHPWWDWGHRLMV